MIRSILFVPGDSRKKIERSADCGADAIILDLEDSVVPNRKDGARAIVRATLETRATGIQHWVRINALDSGDALTDLAAVVGGAPDCILLPKANGAADIVRLDHYLTALETREGLPIGRIRVATVATETAAAMFGLGSYTAECPRLFGLTWGGEDLATAVGARSNRNADGTRTPLFELARSLCLAAAASARVTAIDTASMDIADLTALEADCDAARRDGFRAKLAIHPAQIEIINCALTPTSAELADARAIVAAFDAAPDVGAFQIGGRMIDIPHLRQAQSLLAQDGGGERCN